MTTAIIDTPTGHLLIHEEAGVITRVTWTEDALIEPSSALLGKAADQLTNYFNGQLTAFDLPFSPGGTDFQKQVWTVMQTIPYGEVMTYGEIAKELNSAPRAVGGACGRNPIPVIIPCHRVVGGSGKMTGFSGGKGISTKEELLKLEQQTLQPTLNI